MQLSLSETALDAYADLVTGTLEWRTEVNVELLRAQGGEVTSRAPASWDEWVDAYTNLYSPPNRIAILARATAEPKHSRTTTQ